MLKQGTSLNRISQLGQRCRQATLRDSGSGSGMIRRLLPAAVIIPTVLGLLRVQGQRLGWYDTEFGASLMVIMTVVLLVTAIGLTARALNRADAAWRNQATALRTAHLELQSQSQILQSVLNSMEDGVVVADQHGRFLQFNPAAERILGLGPSDAGPEEWATVYGCHLRDRTTPYPPTQFPLARALRGDTVAEEELFVRNANLPDGAWISMTGQPVRQPDGSMKGGVIVFRDVTERKQVEALLRNSHDELERRVADRTKELAESNRELAQKNQENEMFVYSVSHDLRSPLVNLQGFSKELDVVAAELKETLEDEAVPEAIRKQATALLDEDVQQSLGFIQTAVSRLGSIIEALLRLSRVGRVQYQCKPVDIEALMVRVVEAMSSTLYEGGIDVRVQEMPPCYGDEAALEQLFANLIGNALKYRDPRRDSIIEIGTSDQQESATGPDTRTYFVKDNGLGIPAAHQEKIFQAFKRAHPHVAPGDGMGLAIVRRTVERHGGTVWLESQEGKGSTFFVTLPVQASTQMAEAIAPDAVQGAGEHGSGTSGHPVGGRR